MRSREHGIKMVLQQFRAGLFSEYGKPHAAGPCAFGADEDSARIILTAMKFDPLMRSAATLRFSRKVLIMSWRACSLNAVRLILHQEPPGISTMDWGVASCCNDGVPDVCYDTAAREKKRLSIFLARIQSSLQTILLCFQTAFKYRTLRNRTWESSRHTSKISVPQLLAKQREYFSSNFDENKQQLGTSAIIASKRVRNRVAGYITRKINTKRRS